METNLVNKSHKTCNRIAAINVDLGFHRENIKLLIDAIDQNRFIESTPFAPRVIKYSCIPKSERRFLWTLGHLKNQVQLLEMELETLIKYGE